MLRDTFPAVPVMVNEAAVGFVDRSAVRVSVLDPAVLAGANEAVTPAGSPDALKVTFPVKLPRGIMMTRLVALRPWGTETIDEEVESVKSLGPALGEGSTSYSG
jgi:hypothetical protein